jgi:hypothetical protein
MKAVDFKGILDKNPGVDRAKVKEVLDTVEEIKKRGIKRASYSLVSPYSGEIKVTVRGKETQIVKLRAK